MTVAEMSAELDVIYENINKNGAPGLDDYEKSVILTHAENLVVNQILTVDPSAATLPQLVTVHTSVTPTANGFNGGSVFELPTNGIVKVLNERVTDTDDESYVIIPITNTKFDKERSTPYNYPPRRRAWRLPIADSIVPSVEVFGRPNSVLEEYKLRYVRKPLPIITANLRTASPFSVGMVNSVAITSGGTGYSVNDILSVTGTVTNATFLVMAVNTGVITDIILTNKGAGVTASAAKATSRIFPVSPVNTTATLNITVVDADTIDGLYLPTECELDITLHREIVKVASTLAEQYYYDKYGTNGNQRQAGSQTE